MGVFGDYRANRSDDFATQFNLRRARLLFLGHLLSPDFKYFVQMGFETAENAQVPGAAALLDFYFLSTHLPLLNVQVGQYKVFFNRSQINNTASMQFAERAPVMPERFLPHFKIAYLLAVMTAACIFQSPVLIGGLLLVQFGLWIGSSLGWGLFLHMIKRLALFFLVIGLSYAFVPVGDADHWVNVVIGQLEIPLNLGGLSLALIMVPRDGVYRISLGARTWITVLESEREVPRVRPVHRLHRCGRIHKSNEFELKKGSVYWIELSGSEVPTIPLLISPEEGA